MIHVELWMLHIQEVSKRKFKRDENELIVLAISGKKKWTECIR